MSQQRAKSLYPALFEPGFVSLEESDIERVFVDGNRTPRRRWLANQLHLFIAKLRSLGVRGDLWIDGSFTTKNPNPTDVDLLLVIPITVLKAMENHAVDELAYLSGQEGRKYVREKWGCDLYVSEQSDLAKIQTFRQQFSRNAGEDNKKGIVVIKI